MSKSTPERIIIYKKKTYAVNVEEQTLQVRKLLRSDFEQVSGAVGNGAGGSYIFVEGLGGKKNEGGPLWSQVSISIAPFGQFHLLEPTGVNNTGTVVQNGGALAVGDGLVDTPVPVCS